MTCYTQDNTPKLQNKGDKNFLDINKEKLQVMERKEDLESLY